MRIEIDNISKYFGHVRALRDFSLEVPSGQIIAVLGRNGAGKTTLLRCLATLMQLDKGSIWVDGQRLLRDRVDLRMRMMFLPDFPIVFGEMSVARHLGMVLRLYNREELGIEDAVAQVLTDLDILPFVDTPLAHLSRGQLHKVALTALLVVDPELWLLDEPFASGMDPHGIQYFKQRAREAAARGRTIMYTTQILEIAERFCDRACIIERGSLRFWEDLEALRKAESGEGTARILEGIFNQLREAR